MILAFEITVIVFAIVYCFLGYRLARILLPLCGAGILFGLIFMLLPENLLNDRLELIVFAGSMAVIFYVVLFMLKRAAAFIVGFVAAACAGLFIVCLFGLDRMEIVAPVVVSVCILCALLCFFYQRSAVIAATSVLGGGIAAVFGTVLYLSHGVSQSFTEVLQSSVSVVSENTLPVSIIAFGSIAAGMLLQFFVFSERTVLPGRKEARRAAEAAAEAAAGTAAEDREKGNNSYI